VNKDDHKVILTIMHKYKKCFSKEFAILSFFRF